MRKLKHVALTGWAIKRLAYNGEIWPWFGPVVHRTRRGAIAAWVHDYDPWKQCYRAGDRCVRVEVSEARHA